MFGFYSKACYGQANPTRIYITVCMYDTVPLKMEYTFTWTLFCGILPRNPPILGHVSHVLNDLSKLSMGNSRITSTFCVKH